MLHVGLTGGIACGKSTVAAMMRELGCQVLEADLIAHDLMEPGQAAYEEVVHEFGEQVRAADGRIERSRLAGIIFADPAKREKLNRIVHPRVVEALDRKLGEIESRAPSAVVVVEAALLIEAGYNKRLDRLVVVWCELAQQLERLLARGLTRREVEQRLQAQLPAHEKRRMADDVIDCSGSLELTRRQVERLVAKFRQLAATMAAKEPS